MGIVGIWLSGKNQQEIIVKLKDIKVAKHIILIECD
jgi:hypothetical protein